MARFSLKERDRKVDDRTEIELQNFLIKIVTTLDLLPTYVFIDALDKGDKDDIRRTIAFFKDVGQRVLSSCVWLRICFSSRHYPYITFVRDSLLLWRTKLDMIETSRYIFRLNFVEVRVCKWTSFDKKCWKNRRGSFCGLSSSCLCSIGSMIEGGVQQ